MTESRLYLTPGGLPMWALTMPSMHFKMVGTNTETARENVSEIMGLDWDSFLLQSHRIVFRASLAVGKKEKKALHFGKWLATLQLKPILNSSYKRKKEPLNSLEMLLILIIYRSDVLHSHWTREYWATVSRTRFPPTSGHNFIKGSLHNLVYVCFCFKAHYLIYTFGSWILNSPPMTF